MTDQRKGPGVIVRAAELNFAAGGNAPRFQIAGWSHPEQHGTWCLANQAALRFQLPPGTGNIVFECALEPYLCPPGLSLQRIGVRANGRPAGQAAVRGAAVLGFEIPHDALAADGTLDITLTCPDATAPAHFGQSDDTRVLAFHFRRARLFTSPAEPPVYPRSMPPLPKPPGELPHAMDALVRGVTTHALPDLMMQIESLGHNCEFGLIQRRCGAEPLGLLRFVGVTALHLIQAIDDSFSGLDDPANTRIYPGGENEWEWIVTNTRYDMTWHTFLPVTSIGQAQARRQEALKQSFKQRRFLELLGSGDHLFIYHYPEHDTPAHVLPILHSLRMHGDNALLFVAASPDHAPGSVDRLSRNLYRGNIDRFPPIGRGDDDNLRAWISIAANAYRLWREVHGAATT